ncbi:MAG: hypothetical protein RJA51_1409 [Actinomycetota bacterium]
MGDTGGTDSHYFSEEPAVASRIVTYAFAGPGGEITVASDTGVFSHGALDKATANTPAPTSLPKWPPRATPPAE